MYNNSNRFIDPVIRFNSRINKTNDCWIWVGAIRDDGYGAMSVYGKVTKVHRFSWEMYNNTKIPEGKHVLHKCDNPACVNPKHLYLGDDKQNAKDRDSRGRNGFSKRTHCKHGHEFTKENTYMFNNVRMCRQCNAIHNKNKKHGFR